MKSIQHSIFMIITGVLLGFAGLLNAAETVTFSDANLEAAVRSNLGIPSPTPITTDDMLNLILLSATNKNITTLGGLEHAANLESLDLSNNNFTLLGINCEKWTKLKTLRLRGTPITDLYLLGNWCPLLEYLVLSQTQIQLGMASLGLCQSVKTLTIDHANLTDISELANLTHLETLYLRNNSISDISALQFMSNLQTLELMDNLITDLSPLASLNQLVHLSAYDNQISTVTSILTLTQLERLYLVGNNLDNADLPDFYDFDNLTGLELRENPGITSAAAMRVLGDSLDQMTCEQIIWDGVCSDGLNLPPNPEIQSVTPNPANVWEVVTVQATAVDPETQNVKMQIDWGDGVMSDYQASYQASGSSFYFTKTYSLQGTYEIRVRAKDTGDNESNWSDATEIVVIRPNHAPEGEILSATPNPVSMNQLTTVQVLASDQDDDSVQVKLYWGDGSFDDYSALAPNGSFFSSTHSYLGPGTYTVNAIVRDSYGLEGDWTEAFQITVTAPNTPPTCEISSLTPNPAETGQTVTVRVQATDPEGKTVRMQVDWGDGDLSGYSNYQSSGHIFEETHVYSNLGNYSVRAAAQDYEGLTGPWCTATPITVNNSTNHAPRVQIENITPETVSTGQPVTLKAMGIDFDNHQLQYQVDWGDGEIETFTEFSPSGTTRYFRHIYWQAGEMTLKVRAKDERQMAGSWREGGPISISQGFNMPPQIANINDFRQINTQSYVIYLDHSATDDHNQPDELEWEITADATEVDIHLEDRKVLISAPFWEGTSRIYFEVTDQHGAPDTYSVEAEFFAPDRGDTLSIMSYDLSAFPLSDAENKTEALRLLIQSQNPTILVVQELGSSEGRLQLLNNVLNSQDAENYAAAPIGQSEHALFYQPKHFLFANSALIDTDSREIAKFELRSVQNATTPIYLFSVHFDRNNSTQSAILAAELEKLPAGSHFMVCGNLNQYSGFSNAFTTLAQAGCLDPAEKEGEWHGNSNYADVHTYSVNQLRERYDFILCSAACFDNQAFQIHPLTYTAVGNDGNHFMQAIDTGINTSLAFPLAQAARTASDHLPVQVYFHTKSLNEPPQIISAQQVDVNPGEMLSYTAIAIDPMGDPVFYKFRNYPVWMTPSRSSISGLVPETASDTSFTVVASDGELEVSLTVIVHILTQNLPPVISSPATAVTFSGDYFTYTAAAHDPEGLPVTIEFGSPPSWLTATGNILRGVTPAGSATEFVTITANDGEKTSQLQVTITIHAENQPPQITSAAAVVAYNDSVFDYHASAIDPEGFPISWHFSNYPEWMTATGESIQGTVPKYLTNARFDVEASDGSMKTTQTVQVTLISLNKPPRIISAEKATAYQGQLFEYEARATDPEGKPVTFIFTRHPAWLTSNNAYLSGITPENASDTSFVFIANDGDYADTLNVALTVMARNKAPYFISANQAQATENQPFQYVSHGIDPEGQPLFYKFFNYPSWLTPADSILAGTPPNNAAHSYFDAIISDGLLADTMRVTLNVITVNDPPQIQKLTDFSFDSQREYVIDLDSCAVDPDNATTELSWQIFPGNSNLNVNMNNHIAVFSTTGYLENTDIFFKVQDPQGSAAIQIVRVDITHTSGVEADLAAIPRQFELKPNYPNPFNPETTVTYGLPKSAHIQIRVFDNRGRLVETLSEGLRAAGYHTITWQAEKHTSGVYYFQLQAGDYSQTRKCVLLK